MIKKNKIIFLCKLRFYVQVYPKAEFFVNHMSMRILSFLYGAIVLLLLSFLLHSCANIVAPTGGPIDEDPPVVLRSTPPNYSTRYKGQDVRIFFDEFVELRNLRQNLLVSPPLKDDPEVRVRGRSIIMSVSDTLMPNTTYNFFFGESIVDITEGNAIPNFQFVVSTGDYVDSLSVRGRVWNAQTLKPEKGVFVMLYDDIYDSVPMLERPVYLSKTDEEGRYTISNMREGEYLMFALKDLNNNYLYDNPEEKIAFLDSLIRPEFAGPLHVKEEREEEKDADKNNDDPSPGADTLLLPNDTDTLNGNDTLRGKFAELPVYELFLFQEKDTVQRVLSSSLATRGKLSLAFRIPADSVFFTELREPLDDGWYLPEYSKKRDTLVLWMPDMKRDSLFLEVHDRGHIVDTIKVSTVPRAPRTRGIGRSQEPEEETEPVVVINAPGIGTRSVQPYFKHFELVSQTPLVDFDPELFELFLSDSIPVEADFEFADELQRKMRLTYLLEPDSSYRLKLYPGSVTDIFGASYKDTLTISFRVDDPTAYATIDANITLPPEKESVGQYILQLMDDALEKVIDEKIIFSAGTYRFQHLRATNFRFRIIEDKNKNGKWDTGNYLKGIQPEKVYILPEPIQTRLNWEVEVVWQVE